MVYRRADAATGKDSSAYIQLEKWNERLKETLIDAQTVSGAWPFLMFKQAPRHNSRSETRPTQENLEIIDGVDINFNVRILHP